MPGTLGGSKPFERSDAESLSRYAEAAATGTMQHWRAGAHTPADVSMIREVARRMAKEVREGSRQKYTTAEVELIRETGVELYRFGLAAARVPDLSDEERAAAERQLAQANELFATAMKMESQRSLRG